MKTACSITTVAAALFLVSLPVSVSAGPGEDGYGAHCAGCHQPDGEGMEGVFPALNGTPLASGEPSVIIDVVLNGKGDGMPAFGSDLSDADVAAIVSHLRTSWSNKASAVSAAEVAAVRAKKGVSAGM